MYILFFSVYGCASFSKKSFKNEYAKFPENNISQLEGEYKIYSHKAFGKGYEAMNEELLKRHTNFYNIILNENIVKNDSILNEIDNFKIRVIVKNKNQIEISFLNKESIVHSRILSGRLKKDGMFYLDNKYLECHGIPYLLGGCVNSKRRLVLTNNKNLIINEAFDNYGAFLLVIGSGYSINTAYEFLRL